MTDIQTPVFQENTVKITLSEPAGQEPEIDVPLSGKLYSGRINRLSYFTGPFIIEVITFFASLGLSVIYDLGTETITYYEILPAVNAIVFAALFAVYGLSFMVRRAHDIGKSWLFLLLFLIPAVNVFAALALFLWPGNRGENRYGQQPKPGIDAFNLFCS